MYSTLSPLALRILSAAASSIFPLPMFPGGWFASFGGQARLSLDDVLGRWLLGRAQHGRDRWKLGGRKEDGEVTNSWG